MRLLATMRLSDGRLLEFAEYGKAEGDPYLFFHGFIGSQRQAACIDFAASANGMRIIAPNRPGRGKSDFKARPTMRETIGDVSGLADYLGLKTFGVIGLSAGATYAMVTAASMPERVQSVALISGLGQFNEIGALRGMFAKDRLILNLGEWRAGRMLMRAFLRRTLPMILRNPERFLERLTAHWNEDDKQILRRPDVRQAFLEDLRDMCDRPDAAEIIAHELMLYANWGMPTHEIPDMELLAWHGTHDRVVPTRMTRVLAGKTSLCSTEFLPGGHLMVIDNADAIIGRLAAVNRTKKN